MNATMPIFLSCLGWLVSRKAWRPAFWWAFLFLGGLTLVAATKIAFAGWGIGIRSLDYTGFSGHAMRATALAPMLLYLALRDSTFAVRGWAAAIGISFGWLITLSRLAVDAHSVSEALSGFLLGIVVALYFIKIASSHPTPRLSNWLVFLIFIFLIGSPAAKPAPTETWVQRIAVQLSGREKPFTRADWQKSDTVYSKLD